MNIDETDSPTRTQNRDILLGNNLGCTTNKIPENIEILKICSGDLILLFEWLQHAKHN